MSNSKCVYYKEKEQKSVDGGITWVDTGRFRKGGLVSTQAAQCGSFTDEYRWIKADYVCDNGNKYNGYKQQVSYDNGGNWSDTGVVNIGDLIEENSKDCAGDTGTTTGGTPSMKVIYVDGTSKTFYDLTRIEQNTDSNKANAKRVEIYDGVTSIGKYAFNNCHHLTGITLPNSVTSIGNSAFDGCSSLTGITIPNSVTSIGVNVFVECENLENVIIGTGIKTIDESVFYKCSSLTDITIPNSVTYIGRNVFGDCTSLTSVTIPNSVKIIGKQAFNGCSSLTDITVPSSVTSIGYTAFAECSSLKTITVKATTPPTLDFYAFRGCPITTIYVPSESVDAYKTADGITSAGGITADGWKDYADKIQAIP